MSKQKSGADMVTVELGGYEIRVSLDYQALTEDSDDGPGEDEGITITGLKLLLWRTGEEVDAGTELMAILEDISGAMEHIESLCWEQRERDGGF